MIPHRSLSCMAFQKLGNIAKRNSGFGRHCETFLKKPLQMLRSVFLLENYHVTDVIENCVETTSARGVFTTTPIISKPACCTRNFYFARFNRMASLPGKVGEGGRAGGPCSLEKFA